MLIPILILVALAVVIALMASGRVPAVVALPFLAIVLAVIGGIPGDEIQKKVIGDGIMMLRGAYIPTIVAAILGEIVRRTGIAENIVRRAAELGGDNPVYVAILCFLAAGFAFTGLSGTGSVIMLGMIVLPIMISVGVPRRVAAAALLMGSFLGYTLNVARWKFIMELVGANLDMVKTFAMTFLIPGVIITITMIVLGCKLKSPLFAWAVGPSTPAGAGVSVSYERVPVYALITPIIPLILVVAFKMDFIAAFLIAMVYGILSTQWKVKYKGVWDLVTRSVFEGFSVSALTVSLMFGIGMLVTAAMHPKLVGEIGKMVSYIYPGSVLTFVLLFGVFGPPLTQYRGPMNPWGLGAALAKIMASGALSLQALVAGFWVLDYVVGVSCPTSSQVAWTAGAVDKSPVELQKLTLPVTWLTALVGVLIATFMFPVFK